MTPRFSFIVPAYNEEALIGSCVEAIRQGAGGLEGGFEIIVVNDASTDRTAQMAREKGARVIDVHKRQIAAVRNAGAKVAAGEIFVFVDADTLVTRETLVEVEKWMRDARAVGGGARLVFDRPPPWWGKISAKIFLLIYFAARLAAGGFIFTRREAFEKVGGFDERYFAGEEIHLSRALKRLGKFKIIPQPVITSARKFRMKTPRDHLALLKHLTRTGMKGWKSREGLDMWYDGSREP